jgi:anti-anti-sigma regulatory factor
MLQINVPLAKSAAQTEVLDPSLMPCAGVRMELKAGERRVDITLKGVICGASADSLLEFLRSASALVGNKWSLQMSELLVLSSRGMKTLALFAKHMRRRGCTVEVQGVNQNLYAAMKEMKLARAFAWTD